MIECDRARKKRTDFKNLCAIVIVSEEPIKEREPITRFPLKVSHVSLNYLLK